MEKNQEKIVSTNPYCSNGVPVVGKTGWDTEYKSIEIVDDVVKVGEPDKDGKQKYSVVKVVHESFTPIQQVIDADAQSVGVYNIMKSVAFQDDQSMFADKGSGQMVDLTGAPENLMELKQMAVDGEKSFNQLPEDLTKGMDMAAFVNSMDQAQFDAFIASIKTRLEGEKKDE